MNFDWSPEQSRLYNETLEGARSIAPDLTPDGAFRERWRRLGGLGVLGLSAPKALGGGGHDALTTALAVEAFGRGSADMGLVFAASAHLFACVMPLAEAGSDDVKRRLVPGLCSGELVGANAITEPEAGSDVGALACRAEADGRGGYSLTGEKSFVTNGPVADAFVVYATRNKAHGFMGISAFVVERGNPGLAAGPRFEKVGLSTAQAGRIELRDCRVGAAARLGGDGAGSSIFQRSMAWERACLFASYVGMLDRQLEQTVAFARARKQFGRPIARNQAVSHRIVDMKLRLEQSRLLLYRACFRFDRGERAALDIALSKIAVSHAAVRSSLDAVHLHGGAGVESERGVERMLRDALPCTIFSGTSEIQRDLAAGELGL